MRKSYGEEWTYVIAEGGHSTASDNERKNIISIVVPRVKVPATQFVSVCYRTHPSSDSPSVTSDSDVSRNRDRAVCVVVEGEGPSVEVSEPDHDLIRSFSARGVGGKKIIGNISFDRSVTLGPVPR